MSTRAVIAKSENKGCYCHWDGYPSYLGIELCKLIKRDGADKVIKTICDDHYEWSSIDFDLKTDCFENSKYYDNICFGCVEGYGVFYAEADGANPDNWLNVDHEEWGYIIKQDGKIVVFKGNRKMGIVDALSSDAENSMKKLDR